jgi:hypothetical protein
VKKRLAEIATAEGVFKEAAGVVEKYKTQYPELSGYDPSVDLHARRITFRQTLTGERPDLAVYDLMINEQGGAFTAKRAGKEDENVGAHDWNVYLHTDLAGIVAAILYAREKR